MQTLTPDANTATADVVLEAEWEGFIRSLHIWEMRRLCKNELAWHDAYVAGKLDLLEVYREIAEKRDYEKAGAGKETTKNS